MKRRIVRRVEAKRDIESIALYLGRIGGIDVGMKFVDAVEATLRRVARSPFLGSPYEFAHRNSQISVSFVPLVFAVM